MSDADEIQRIREADALRSKNRQLLVESKMLMVKLDHSKKSAADGGYADGRYADLYTPDGRFEAPFMPAGLKNYRQGREEHEADAEMRFNLLAEYKWIRPLDIYDCVDPNKFFVLASGAGTTVSGAEYSNEYVMYFEFENGKIKLYREYFDPNRMAAVVPVISSTPGFTSDG